MGRSEWRKDVRRLVLAGLFGCLSGGCDQSKPQPPAVASTTVAEAKAAPPKPQPTQPERPAENTLRLVIVGPGEPLTSEHAQLSELRAALKKAKIELDAAAPNAAEKQAALDLAAEKSVANEAWSKFETVVVLEMVAPEGSEKGKRLSRGRGHLFIVHPPEKDPVFSTIYKTPEKGAWLDGGKLGVWLATHLRYRKGGQAKAAEPEKHEPAAQKVEVE